MHLKKLIHNLIFKMNLNPNLITIIGSIGPITGSVLLIFFIRLLGIIFIVLFSFFDAIDGTIARILNKESSLGKFLDSNLDRFVDTSIFLAILSQINQNELFEIQIERNKSLEYKKMLAVTLTIGTLVSIMFFFVGGVVGWLARENTWVNQPIYTHPEMFDENGNVLPDEILAVRFENDYEPDEDNEDD